MQIKGIVEEIIFRSDDNGYTVLNLDAGGELVTCVGVFSFVATGEELSLSGDFTNNPRFGKQFAIKEYSAVNPSSTEGILKYLSSGIIKGIGEGLALRIVSHFGKDTLNIIEFNPRRLSEVRGISAEGAIRIGENFGSIKKMKDTIMFLQKFEVSISLAIKIFDCYKNHTIERVSKNPYRLVEDVDGIGFLTADKIARKMGIKENSPYRMRAGILHCLKQIAQSGGSTYALKTELFRLVSNLLENDAYQVFEDALTELKLDGTIKTFFAEGFECAALTGFYLTEQSIAAKLVLLKGAGQKQQDYTKEIKKFEEINKISFHKNQLNAIKTALNSGVSVITGGPGTGKTTIIKCIYSVLRSENKTVLLLAPTGRASKRLSESVDADAKTIHRGLEVEVHAGRLGFKYNENNKLTADTVIVDEVSMLDCMLMSCLLKAIKPNCKLILVGDHNQLPSVGAGNVLADIIDSACFNVEKLNQIYRQSDNSLIIENAHKINAGEMPDLSNKSCDFFFEKKEEPEEIAKTVVDLVSSRLPAFAGMTPQNIQVLSPLKIGKAGIDALNAALQEKLNPQKFGGRDIEFERIKFRQNDKVMQMQNNYELEWEKTENMQKISGAGVFNGDIGTIILLNAGSGEVCVEFDDGRKATYTRADLNQLTLAYAVTVHKSQGCEFDAVVIPVVMGAPIIFTRNLLYTAVTRAKKLVVLVGTKMAISRMVRNNYIEKRSTNLKNMLIAKQKEFEQLYG